MTRLALALACASALGCGSPTNTEGGAASGAGAESPRPEGPATAVRAAGHMDGPYYVEGDTPDPRACATDDECLGDTVTDAEGCCVISSTPVPQTRGYHTWLSSHRSGAACVGAGCVMFSPSRPLDCEIAVRCVDARCVNSCP